MIGEGRSGPWHNERVMISPGRRAGAATRPWRRAVLALVVGALIGHAPVPGSEATAPAAADGPPDERKVRADLVSEVRAVAPGSTFWVGLRQRIAPGWHTYWVNPGDSGEPATVDWTLPAGFQAGPVAWPYPQRIPVGHLMSYGYTDEVVLPIPITAPAELPPGARVTLEGRARWLVCEKICIPEEAPVALTLRVGAAGPDPAGAAVLARARRAVPFPSPWPASFEVSAGAVTLTVAAPGLARERLADAWFYPLRWGVIEHAAAQQVEVTPRGITLRDRKSVV